MRWLISVLVLGIIIIGIWIFIEIKRLRHKLFAIFLIALILFFFFSIVFTFRGQDIDLKTVPGIVSAANLYFSWLGGIFANLKTMTSYATKMNWGTNQTIGS